LGCPESRLGVSKFPLSAWRQSSADWPYRVTAIGVVRLILYYYRFQPDNIDRSYSVSYTVSGMEVNIAIVAACGPAIKALCTRYGVLFLSSRPATRPSAYAYYSPDDTARQRHNMSDKASRSDAQYGLRDLGTKVHDGDGDSQEAIVSRESNGTRKSEFDFGFEAEQCPRAYGKGSHHNLPDID